MKKEENNPKTQKEKLTSEIKGIKEMLEYHEKNKMKFRIIMISIFAIAAFLFCILVYKAPPITPDEKLILFRVPGGPSDLKEVLSVLNRYNKDHKFWVTAMWVYLYIL